MIILNAEGQSRLTKWDKAEISNGRNPGDDGTGRAFIGTADGRTLLLVTPTDAEPIAIGRIAEPGEEVVVYDQDDELASISLEQRITELTLEIQDARETHDRLIAQRDQACTERDELRSMNESLLRTISEARGELRDARSEEVTAVTHEDLISES